MKRKCQQCGKRVPRQYTEAHKRFHGKQDSTRFVNAVALWAKNVTKQLSQA